MAEQNLISASRQSDFYDFYTDDYCNKLRRRTFTKAPPTKGEARPKKPHGLLIWRFLFYLLLIPTIIAVGATLSALQPIYQRGAELLSIPSLLKFEPSEREKEISGFLGKNIDTIQDSLPLQVKSGGQYGYNVVDPGLYASSSALFRCLCDDNGKIIQISLSQFGSSPYTIYGIEQKADNAAANSLLNRQGFHVLTDGYWVSQDSTRIVLHEDDGWILRYANDADDSIQLKAMIDRDFKYIYPDSVGAYYLGNGQVLEYYHDSFAEFCYQYSQTTQFNRQSMGEKADGRYILVLGEVTDVLENGMVKVFCADNEATQAAGKIWPMQGIANVTIRPEQAALLGKLKKDTKVMLFARLITSSYDGILGSEFSMEDGIILQIDGTEKDVPVFSDSIPGIQHYHIENGSAVSDQMPVVPDTVGSGGTASAHSATEATLSEEDIRMNAMNMLESVLYNEAPFFFCEQNDFRYLYEVDSAGENQFDSPLTPVSYTRVNMDQSKDGIVEMLVQMENEMNGWVLVLYYNRQLEYVQGYIFPFRGMKMVMIDGTFSGSSSAFDTNLYRLKFNDDWYEEVPVYDHWTEELAYWIDIS